MKRLLVVLLVVIIAIPVVVYAGKYQGEYYDEDGEFWYDIMYCIVNPKTNGGLNVRWKPNKGSGVCYSLGFGDKVIVTDERNGWVYCIVNGEGDRGWVSKKYLSYFEPVLVDEDMLVVSDGRVIVRNFPNKNGKKYKWVKNGDTVHIMYDIGDYYITKNWKFISCDYVQYIEESIEE